MIHGTVSQGMRCTQVYHGWEKGLLSLAGSCVHSALLIEIRD